MSPDSGGPDHPGLDDAGKGYSQIYLDHALNPRNTGSREGANGFAGLTARDGSDMEIWLKIDHDVITDASFRTGGCSSTIACGSMATELAKGQSLEQAFDITAEKIDIELGGLPGAGCTCAKLASATLKAALRDYLAYKNEPWRRKYESHGSRI